MSRTIIKGLKGDRLSTFDFQMLATSAALFCIQGKRDQYQDRLREAIHIIEICGKGKTPSVIKDEFIAYRNTKKPIFFTYPVCLRDTPFLLNEVQARGSAIIVSRTN